MLNLYEYFRFNIFLNEYIRILFFNIMKSFNGLSEQIFEKPFRKMLFSVYNLAEEDGYQLGLERMGFDNDIESLEFIMFDTPNMEEFELKGFKYYIEDELQHGNVLFGVILIKTPKLGMVGIKPKKVDIGDIFSKS